MKNLKDIIIEKLVLNKSTSKSTSKENEYNYYPKNSDELKNLLKKLLKERGENADLNDIDTSAITDMTWLFDEVDPHNIDISEWDVSNVTDMCGMFSFCKKFNCDLSGWDVSKATNISYMFYKCENFNSDLSSWDVSNVKSIHSMFAGCKKFNCDLSNWNVKNVYFDKRRNTVRSIFSDCQSLTKLPDWEVK